MFTYKTCYVGLLAMLSLCISWNYAAPITPNPYSKLAGKRILVLAGPSTSHAQARAAATKKLDTIKTKIGCDMTFGNEGAVSDAYLLNYDIVVFNYYFQSERLSDAAKESFKKWFALGNKGYVGYHTSGANEAGEWDWYRDNVTSMRYIVHSGGAQNGTIYKTKEQEVLDNPIMEGLDESFTGSDEWYDFEYGITFDDAKVMYYLDETTLRTPLQRPMDPHPMAWYREDAAKTRYFYTAIIHTSTGAETEFFGNLILRALEWVAGYEKPGCPDAAYAEYDTSRTVDDSTMCETPVGVNLNNNTESVSGAFFNGMTLTVSSDIRHRVTVHNIDGKEAVSLKGSTASVYDLTGILQAGVYYIQVTLPNAAYTKKIVLY